MENVPTSSKTPVAPSVTTPAPHGQGWVSACNMPCFIALSVVCVVGISLITALVVVAVRMRRRPYISIENTSETQRMTMVYNMGTRFD